MNEQLLKLGQLDVRIYDMDLGDRIPNHSHGEKDSHILVCARGSVRIITPEWEKILNTGDVIEFFPLQKHEIVSMQDNSRVVNVVK